MPHNSSDDDESGYASNRSPSSSTSTPKQQQQQQHQAKRHSKRTKEKKKEAAATAAAQQEIIRQLASLQLPHHMPNGENSNDPPTLRILVVADIDLASASALAESALSSSVDDNPLTRVDLCIACGPFCREDDLRSYYQGRQRRRHLARYNQTNHNTNHHHHSSHSSGGGYASSSAAPFVSKRGGGAGMIPTPLPPTPHPNHHHHNQNNHHHNASSSCNSSNHYPYKRTREETAALEGLMTAALSQLESIVCRVVFVPGRTDPITTITSSSHQFSYTKERRLTPNSRNIHQHWTPLSPGLGCAGLLYLDWQRLQQPPPLEDDDDDDDEDDDDDDDSESSSVIPEDSSFSYGGDNDNLEGVPPSPQSAAWNNTHNASAGYDADHAKQYGTEFCTSLEKLVQLAPPTSAVTDIPPTARTHAQISGLLKTTLFQSILVTHFHHLEKEEDDSEFPLHQHHHDDNDETTNENHHPHPHPHHHPHHDEDGHDEDGHGVEDDDEQQHEQQQQQQQEDDEEEEESFDPPWPTEHEAFCALPLVQEHVLLEIAAGRNSMGATVKPMEVPKGKIRVVLPGSLRERGEFCLVDVAFMKDPYHHKANDYRWRVRRTRFQTINEYL